MLKFETHLMKLQDLYTSVDNCPNHVWSMIRDQGPPSLFQQYNIRSLRSIYVLEVLSFFKTTFKVFLYKPKHSNNNAWGWRGVPKSLTDCPWEGLPPLRSALPQCIKDINKASTFKNKFSAHLFEKCHYSKTSSWQNTLANQWHLK